MNFNAQSRSPGHCGPYVLETVISEPHIRDMLQDVWYMMSGVWVCLWTERKRSILKLRFHKSFTSNGQYLHFSDQTREAFKPCFHWGQETRTKRHFYPLQCLTLFIPETSFTSNKLDQWSSPVIHFHICSPHTIAATQIWDFLKAEQKKTNSLCYCENMLLASRTAV